MADLPTASTWFPTVDGLPGKSAYEIAVDEGFLGSEAQWLATLVGAQGIQGVQGATGPAGTPGVVQSIVAGTNVTVNSTDPANPIVSASGGGSGGVAANWPSGARYFWDVTAPFLDVTFSTVDTAKMWIMTVDSQATFTGIEYSLAIADATAEVWFEIHAILGSGLPGNVIASLQLDTATAATGKILSFPAPVVLPAGPYFFTLHTVAAGAGTGRLDGYSLSTTNANARDSALFITDYWVFMASTTELPAVTLVHTALPGGVYTPGQNWTGADFVSTDVTATGLIPIIGLIKQ